MSVVHYFAYGSNLDGEQMAQRCPSSRVLCRARLPDHRLDFSYFSSRWLGGAADVIPHFGGSVWGVVYELDSADLVELDRYEGGYQRVMLSVEDDRERPRPVLSYSVTMKRSFQPTSHYLGKMLRWGEHWGLPQAYLEELRRIRVAPEPRLVPSAPPGPG